MAGLLAALLIGGIFAGSFAGQWTYGAGLRAERTQQAGRHRVAAVLLAGAPATAHAGDGGLAWALVRARWAAPEGMERTSAVAAPTGARADSTVLVWTGSSGRLTGPPLQDEQLAGQAAFAIVLAVAGLGLVLWCCGMLSHRALDRGDWPPGMPTGVPPGRSGRADADAGARIRARQSARQVSAR